MKTSALILSVMFVFITAQAQNINEKFETQTDHNTLSANCWVFTNMPFTENNKIQGKGSIVSPFSKTGSLRTPLLSVGNSLNVKFDYKLVISSGLTNEIKISLLIDGAKVELETLTIVSTSTTAVNKSYSSLNTPGYTINGNRYLLIEVIGGSEVVMDNLWVNASYSSEGSCMATQTILPIKLISYTGAIVNRKAELQWSVADNETGERFEIEKSSDGRSFITVASVLTSTKTGNEVYNFRDASDLTATAYFRLKITNKDQSVSYSKIITLKSDKETAAANLTIVQNPVAATLQFQYSATATGTAKLVLYNAAGVSIMSKDLSLQKGTNAVSLNLDNSINQGTYFLQISNGTERSIAKLVKK